jgi:rhodanese-related sulfurtransferase
MNQQISHVLSADLSDVLGTAFAPVVVDVRSEADVHAIDRLIPGAIHRRAEAVQGWWRDLPTARPVVVCDLFGGETSTQVAESLRRFGTAASHLVDGFVGWYERGMPTRKMVGSNSRKWVTREHPKIDRIACPWLVQRFIDATAEFLYVPPDQVLAAAEETGAIPYDVEGVEFTHEGDRCSFDKILRVHDLQIPALDRLAAIVRGADTSRPDLSPECDGLVAISRGLSVNFPDDHEMLKHGLVIYDALFTWCGSVQTEPRPQPMLGSQEGRRG